jgi:hypothetical protein
METIDTLLDLFDTLRTKESELSILEASGFVLFTEEWIAAKDAVTVARGNLLDYIGSLRRNKHE